VTRLVFLLLAGCLIALICYSAAANAAWTVQPDRLQQAVDQSAGRHIEITVTPDRWNGRSFVGEPGIWLGRQAYNDAENGGSFGLLVALHEVGHTTGIGDTTDVHYLADCFALAHMRQVLRRFWHVSGREAQARYGDALDNHRHGSTPGKCGAA
jgi:hypothetical protein